MFPSFTGNARKTRNVNLSAQTHNPFASAWSPSGHTGASQTVSNAQAERQKRQHERERLSASRRIQKTWKSHKARKTLRDQRRGELRALYEPERVEGRQRIQEALPLVLSVFDSKVPGDLELLDRVVCDLLPTDLEKSITTSDERTEYRKARLAEILILALRESPRNTHFLHLLAQLAAWDPRALSRVLELYYEVLAQLSQRLDLDDATSKFVKQAFFAPLQAQPLQDAFVTRAYAAFAVKVLTGADLSLVEHDSGILSQTIDMDELALTIASLDIDKSMTPDGALWLLAHFIDLHQRQNAASKSSTYLKSLQILLSNLAQPIKDRTALASGNSKTQDHDSRSESHEMIQPLPPYVADKINSLVDRHGVSAILNELSSAARDPKGGSLLAGYIITLLRCFPSRGDDIRMRLFLGDLSFTADNGHGDAQVPVIKYLWNSTRQTQVYRRILQDTGSTTTELVRSYLSKSTSTPSVAEQEWTLVFLFLELYIFILRLSDDDDFFSCVFPRLLDDSQPQSRLRRCGLSLEELKSLTLFLKNLAFTLHHRSADVATASDRTDITSEQTLSSYFGKDAAVKTGSARPVEKDVSNNASATKLDIKRVQGIVTAALRQLYERDSRRPFLPADHWLMTSKFDMGRFVDAVVYEQQRQQDEVDESSDDEDDELDGDGDVHMSEAHSRQSHTTAGQRLSRHAQIEKLRSQQRKAQRDRMLSIIGPKLEILKHMPFVIPFATRVEIFRKFIENNKHKRRAGMDADQWRMTMINNPLMPESHPGGRHRGTIARGSEFDDAYEQFYDLGESLKEPIQITFVDKFGDAEAGIDGGGVTKEFLTSAIDQAFSGSTEEYFTANKQGLIFPNPVVVDRLKHLAGGLDSAEQQRQIQDILRRYEFLGRLVGKCMYEGILVDISFAGFFLLKWVSAQGGENSYRGNLNDLRDLDESLYQGMLKLKNYTGNVAELDLDFTIEDQISGPGEPIRTVTRNLIPNGENTPVTNDNRLLYISYVARHRLVAQPLQQTAAFLRGLRCMIAPSWLSMFNQNELQRLVGGDSSAIDVDDLRLNTIYSGLYDPGTEQDDHPTIKLFWKVVHGFTDEQRRLLLKYVTSTPRAPLLGFSQLSPRFSIRDGGRDQERLPSTSTCVNLLKLPLYNNEATLRRKLLQAIESGAGFDLS